MTVNLPAIPGPIGMLDPRTDSWTAVVEQVAVLATRIADTELVPAALRGKPAAVAAVILYGREIHLGPMTALRTSYVVNGRVALAAETMRGLVLAAGHDLLYREATSARCVAAGRRHGTENWQTVEWTIDAARQAGLTGQTWQRYPRQMLKARATAELCRDLFPDVIGGFAAVEELDDNGAAPAEPAAPPRKLRRAAPRPPDETQPPLDPVTAPPAQGEVPLPGEDGYEQLLDVPADRAPAVNLPRPEAAPDQDESDTPEASATPGPQRDTDDWAMTRPQAAAMGAAFHQLGLDDRGDALTLTGNIIGRSIDTRNDLTRADYRALMDALATIKASRDPQAMIRDLITADFDPELDANST